VYRNGGYSRYWKSGSSPRLEAFSNHATSPRLPQPKTRIPAKKLFNAKMADPSLIWNRSRMGVLTFVSSDGKFEALPYGSVPRLQTSHVADAFASEA
ncbi:hypothetical protein CEXT_117481, partial [Caerostris extrusa]